MSRKLKAVTPKKRTPQDATRKQDVAPIRRRIEQVESRLAALETWAGHLFNPDTAPKSFERRQVPR